MRLVDALAPLRRAGGAFRVVEHEVGDGFGDELVTVTDGRLDFRIIRDRGRLHLDVRIAGAGSGWIDAAAAAGELGRAVPSIFPSLDTILAFILANRGELSRVLRADHTASGDA